MGIRLHASVPCRLDYRHGVSVLLEALCGGLEERDVYHIVSAFNEAFNNVVEHAQLGVQDAMEVHAERGTDRVALRIVDYGVPYEPELTEPPQEVDPLALSDGGIGLVLIRMCMDEVHYERTDSNVLSMMKRISC